MDAKTLDVEAKRMTDVWQSFDVNGLYQDDFGYGYLLAGRGIEELEDGLVERSFREQLAESPKEVVDYLKALAFDIDDYSLYNMGLDIEKKFVEPRRQVTGLFNILNHQMSNSDRANFEKHFDITALVVVDIEELLDTRFGEVADYFAEHHEITFRSLTLDECSRVKSGDYGFTVVQNASTVLTGNSMQEAFEALVAENVELKATNKRLEGALKDLTCTDAIKHKVEVPAIEAAKAATKEQALRPTAKPDLSWLTNFSH